MFKSYILWSKILNWSVFKQKNLCKIANVASLIRGTSAITPTNLFKKDLTYLSNTLKPILCGLLLHERHLLLIIEIENMLQRLISVYFYFLFHVYVYESQISEGKTVKTKLLTQNKANGFSQQHCKYRSSRNIIYKEIKK